MPDRNSNGRLYFKQLLSGRDFARGDRIASQMVNFTYVVGDLKTRQVVLVDPSYDIAGLQGAVEGDGMEVVGVVATHFHPDHIGGDLFGHRIEGVAELLSVNDVPVHVAIDEVEWIVDYTELDRNSLVAHHSGDIVEVGEVHLELIHTPGHTPGSQCILVDGKLITGDTLFLDGCGRVDLPGGDPEALYESITGRLARISDDTQVYPGHRYSPQETELMGVTREHNYVFHFGNLQRWLSAFGR
ncbi:MAG: MBL fold metallo-hydrolase [Actinobacteria bacterium]|jgi:glyoxylase-like metal-dependent hydrolase (beta-lactamase superfamily II)|nr:MBL fold metallo-hydrolase [Actinomycetota bacterium]MCL6094707.1 MBL fold metallo-hydrolase [Actinomycetota bacterium]